MAANLTRLLGEKVADSNRGYFGLLWSAPMKALFGLQIADVVSTIVFRSMGIAESNPLVDRFMEHFGLVGGLLLIKAAAILVAVACGIAAWPVFVRRINWAYCFFLLLNVLTIGRAVLNESVQRL